MVALGAGSAGRFLLHFVVLVVLARHLSATDFGLVGATTVFIGIGDIVVTVGLGPAIIQRTVLTDRHIRTAFTVTILLGLCLTALVFLFAGLVEALFNIPTLAQFVRVASLMFVVRSFSVVAESLMLRRKKFQLLAILVFVANFCGLALVGIPMALTGFGPWSLIAATLVTAAVTAAGQLLAVRHAKRLLFDRRAAADLLRYGGGNSLARILHTLSLQFDNVIVGRVLGAEALGFYGRAYQIMSFPAILLGEAIQMVFFPVFSEVKSDNRRLAKGLLVSIAAVAVSVGPTAVLVAILAPELVALVLGANWLPIVPPLQIMAGAMVFRVGFKISDSMVQAKDVEYKRALIVGIYALTVLVAAWIGSRWGLSGVAVGVLIALAVDYILMGGFAAWLCGLSMRRFAYAHIGGVCLSLIVGVVALPLASYLRDQPLGGPAIIAVTSVAGVLVAGVVVRYFPRLFLGSDGIDALDSVFGAVPRLALVQKVLVRVPATSGS